MHLKNLYLDDNELGGELSVLGQLPFLEGVFIQNNEFEGDFHTLTDYFEEIMILDASNNRLGGTLPLQFFEKDKLKVLDLNGNQIEGVLPDFPDNDHLEYLALHNNAFNTDVPASVSNLRALTHLDLSSNSLTGMIPESLGNMDLLTYLSLSTNEFAPAPLPAFLQRLTALRELSMRGTRLTGTIPYWMQVLKGLVLLDLGGNALEGELPAQVFSEMKNLTFVQFSDNSLQGMVSKVFAELPALRMFMMEGNSFTALEDGFCDGGGGLVTPVKKPYGNRYKKNIFSGDCQSFLPNPPPCMNQCGTDQTGSDLKELLTGQDLEWDHTYGYWFSSNERIVYDVRPMVAAGELATKDSYAQYNIQELDYGIDDDDDGYFDDDEDQDDDDVIGADDDDDDDDDDFDDDFFDDDIDDDDHIDDDIIEDDDDNMDDDDLEADDDN